MANKISIDDVIIRLQQTHSDLVNLVHDTYKGVGYAADFIDKDYGRWTCKVSHVLNGTQHPSRALITRGQKHRTHIDDVKKRIALVHGDQVVLCDDSYTKVSSPAYFIDTLHGRFCTTPNHVYAGCRHPDHKLIKRQNTNMLRYGVPYAAQNDVIWNKIMNSTHTCTHIKHWKTQQDLNCVASYEVAFVNWCNQNRIDFDWQISHKMPDNRLYRIDAYIKDGKFADTWIEIKGFWRNDAKQKWMWFCSTHPNSQLWDHQRLLELGVLSSKKRVKR